MEIKVKLSVTYLLFILLGVFQKGNLQASNEQAEIPSLAIEQIAMDYLKFNFDVVDIVTSEADDKPKENSETSNMSTENVQNNEDLDNFEVKNDTGLYTGSSVGSSFGMGNILAGINILKTILPVSTPFDSALMDAPDYLTEIYQLLLTTVFDEKEFSVGNTIYMSKLETIDWNTTQPLEQLNTNIFPVDFRDDDVVNVINSEISKRVSEIGLKQSYIPDGTDALPKSTRAMLIHTLGYHEKWSTQWKKIGKRIFNGNGQENVDFIEISGNFPYLESDRALEVSIPIKNDTTRVLSFILPRNIEDALNGNLGEEAHNGTARLRLQIPVFNFTVRLPHTGGVGSADCDFEKMDNFLNVVDDLTFVSFDDEGISAVAITGVQIHNVVEYKEELLKRKFLKTETSPVEENKNFTITEDRVNMMVSNSSSTSSSSSFALPEPAKLVSEDVQSTRNTLDKTLVENEKVITFDRPFTCTLVDDSLFPIPIFSAAVVSLSNVDLRTILPGNQVNQNVFGLDGTLRNLNCL